jgi:CRP-like cAMP-binding protein
VNDRPGSSTAVTKVELKRADPFELVFKDSYLASTPAVKALGQTVSKGTLKRIADKAVALQQGDSGNSLFLILSGEVRLFARKDRDSAELGLARRGELLGEGEVLEGSATRKCSAVAQGAIEVIELPREALLTGGRLAPALEVLLRQVHQHRLKALEEMSDFLNRW